MSKTVLIVSNFHEDASISRSNMAFNYFSERGYDVKVIYSSFSHSLKKYRKLPNDRFISLKTNSYSSSLSVKRILSYLIFSYKVFKFLGNNKFEIVYINLPPNSIGLSVLLRKRSYSKLIVDIIDLWPESFPNNTMLNRIILKISGIIPKIIRKRAIDYSDFCIAESKYFYKVLNLQRKKHKKVIHIKKFQTEAPCYANLSKELSIIYLGNIGAIYDFESLFRIIKGVERKRKVKLHILGLGPLADWLFDNLKANKINYQYHGATFDESIKRSIISECWFGFNGYKDSSEVALSYKSVDYLSYGIPLLNSAKEDTTCLVKDESVGFNFHSDSLEDLIRELSSMSTEQLVEMKRKTYRIFREKFSGESYYHEMDTVIDTFKRKEL